MVEQLSDAGLFDWLLVKADGARKREFKAPGDGEPVVPRTASHVVPVASVAAVGETLTTDVVHRPGRVADITGLDMCDTITPGAVGTVLTHPEGGLRTASQQSGYRITAVYRQRHAQPRTVADRPVFSGRGYVVRVGCL
jgi:probable selenium-dependent hydroxylase accessory protein YqeC